MTGVGGILNGWIDWNNNGHFDASEHLLLNYADSDLGACKPISTPARASLQITPRRTCRADRWPRVPLG